MKLLSWNVNGIRACITKGFYDVLKDSQADIFVFKKQKCKKDKLN